MAEELNGRTYIAIDLKSFYASVECVNLNADPLNTNLVVADESRTDKTICLAVSPSLKSLGVPGRARLFEVKRIVRQINEERIKNAPDRRFSGSSSNYNELAKDPSLSLDIIIARPRMAHYISCSAAVYDIYLRYVAPEDIHVYSIDEVFIDATQYLKLYGMSAHELTRRLISEVLRETGVTATAGIGTNLYLCKIAMDVVAKHMPADEDGVRIAELDEQSYREKLWAHRPITDLWRIGQGYARRLAALGLYTMGDVARCSLYDEDLLFRTFGINAELLIDHAWGWEPCTIADIKAYKPSSESINSGQVLSTAYTNEQAALVVREMADDIALNLLSKKLVTSRIGLYIGYDTESVDGSNGDTVRDRYGRSVPKPANGNINLQPTSSYREIINAASELFSRISDPRLLVRRIYISAGNLSDDSEAHEEKEEQLSLFTDYEAAETEKQSRASERAKDMQEQEAILAIKKKYGNNAILKGMDLQEIATAKKRNGQIGGHKA